MRLFAAVTPPPEVTAELAAATGPLAETWPGLRWAAQDAWHITLAFLGEVEERRLAAIGQRLERAAARHRSMELRVSGAGAFPSARKATVVWAGINGDRRALAALAASVAAAARRAGAPPPDEGRRFRPHLTLARSRDPADVKALLSGLTQLTSASWQAGHVHLIRSHLVRPPAYEVIGTWPLSA